MIRLKAMQSVLLVAVLAGAVLGCSDDVPRAALQPAPPATSSGSGCEVRGLAAGAEAPSGYCASFTGFGKDQDRILGSAPFQGWIGPKNWNRMRDSITYVYDRDVEIPTGIAGWEDESHDTFIGYTYGGVDSLGVRHVCTLFPPGTPYDRWGLTWNIICNDYAPGTGVPRTFSDDTRVDLWGSGWGGITIIQLNPNHVYPQQPVIVKRRGATFTLNDNQAREMTGGKLELPGNKTVQLAHLAF